MIGGMTRQQTPGITEIRNPKSRTTALRSPDNRLDEIRVNIVNTAIKPKTQDLSAGTHSPDKYA